MSANDRQVGGEHYNPGNDEVIPHWDFCTIVQADYLQGYASKYIMRWRQMPKEKSLQDLNKAKHIVEKMLELRNIGWLRRIVVALAGGHAAYRNNCFATAEQLTVFVESNKMAPIDGSIIFGLFLWHKPQDLVTVLTSIDELIKEASK
jgi:hypothetical protein